MTTSPRFGTTGTKMRNKIGIFGGTFNPVHKGHRAVALNFIERLGLDLLYVIPNNIPPLKESHGVSGEDRLKMLELAFSDVERVRVSDIELRREGMSFTCDTVEEIKQLHPQDELFLLTGDDWIDRFDQWRNYKSILENANLVVAYREDSDISDAIERIRAVSPNRVLLLENARMKLSSTDFRSKPDRSLVPDGVYEYIEERGLYRK